MMKVRSLLVTVPRVCSHQFRCVVVAAAIASLLFTFTSFAAPAQANASLAPCGYGYVYRIPWGAFGAGHVGYGISYGNSYYVGSTDGALKNDREAVFYSGMNSRSDAAMNDIMRKRGYSDYKRVAVYSCNFNEALNRVKKTTAYNYSVLFQNCADATKYVLEGFGAKNLPNKYINPSDFLPRVWFDLINGEYHKL